MTLDDALCAYEYIYFFTGKEKRIIFRERKKRQSFIRIFLLFAHRTGKKIHIYIFDLCASSLHIKIFLTLSNVVFRLISQMFYTFDEQTRERHRNKNFMCVLMCPIETTK